MFARSFVAILLGCLLLPVAVPQEVGVGRCHIVVRDLDGAVPIRDAFNWQRQGPIDLLEELKVTENWFTISGTHYDWLRDSDVRTLFHLVTSDESCAYTVDVASSHLPSGRSTVGNEAAFLLEGYIFGYYPPQSTSANRLLSDAQLSRWFERWTLGRACRNGASRH